MFDSATSDTLQGDDTRPVTPRRPLRLAAAREITHDARIPGPALNIFSDVFDTDEAEPAARDPRLARSRNRMRAVIAAGEARLNPEDLNLWHDFNDLADAVVLTEDTAAPDDADALPAVPCSLQAQLHLVRDALYPVDDLPVTDDDTPSTALRLAVYAMNGTLLTIAPPVGVGLMAYSMIKGEDIRLTSRIIALSGTLLAVLHQGFGYTV
jgi:hypothetical protein